MSSLEATVKRTNRVISTCARSNALEAGVIRANHVIAAVAPIGFSGSAFIRLFVEHDEAETVMILHDGSEFLLHGATP